MIPPLDGSRILAGLSRKAREFYDHPQAQSFGLFVLLAIFFVTPLGMLLWGGCKLVAVLCVDLPGAVLGSPPVFDVVSSS